MSKSENDALASDPDQPGEETSVVAATAGLTDAEMTGAVRPDSSRRSTDELHRAIQVWLEARPGLTEVNVSEVVVPESNGMSSETVMVTASWVEGAGSTNDAAIGAAADGASAGGDAVGAAHADSTGGDAVDISLEHRLVFRMAPDMTTLPIFEDYDLGTQFRVMADIARLTDVPVPNAIWYEDDVSHLGSEFFVMDRRDGDIPADVLPYNLGDSFLFDATADDQYRLQTSSVDLLAALHAIPDPLVEFDYLADSVGLAVNSSAMTRETTARTSSSGQSAAAGTITAAAAGTTTGAADTDTAAAGITTGAADTDNAAGTDALKADHVSGYDCLVNQIERMRAHYEYVKRDSRPSPLIDRAFERIAANMPDPATIGEPVLLWGDSRIGNVIYRDFEPVGVLDWEMATIGPREMDVAWMIFMHQFFEDVARQLGMPGMPAFMRRDDVCDRYTEITGHRPTNMGFFAVLAALQHAIIMTQVARRSIIFGGGAAFQNEELPDDMDELIMHRQLLIDYMA